MLVLTDSCCDVYVLQNKRYAFWKKIDTKGDIFYDSMCVKYAELENA